MVKMENVHSPAFDLERFQHRDLTERIIGAFYDVYNELGFGFLESVYHQALLFALAESGVRAESQMKLPVYFRGQIIRDFVADIFVERAVILELKAADELCSAHVSQLLNYLKASPIELGLLLNFGPKPRVRRFVFSNDRKRSRPPIAVD
jgi:GxxExxY protein